ncbi:MAG TPA: transaldolase [Candidatus Limnocylindria bacterium]|nr:transaldolase [Candidatus Limnocylindria bacterium]
MTDRNDGARTALQALYDREGQSPWIDFIDRDLHESGKLDELIGKGIRGLTSNPTIFGKAVATGQYDDLIRRELEAGDDNQQIYEEIAVGDIQAACDHLRVVYDASGGTDGFASIEVEPAWADDTDGTIERARHLWARVDRPNCFVKIPATEAGIPAVEQAISEGINVNVTLMFSVAVYERIARAYLAGLRRRLAGGGDLRRLSSVASFFVSRVDTKVDKQLDELGTRAALEARGRAAVANAKLAYQSYLHIFEGAEFAELRAAGAQVQRCLWASTSTKNPDYRDVMYVEQLIGPDTVNTMPIETIEAFIDHGRVERTIDRDVDDARDAIRAVEACGITMRSVTDELIAEGVASFGKSFDELIASIESQRAALAPA